MQHVYTSIGKQTLLVILTVLLKLKDTSWSQAVMYTVNVVISLEMVQDTNVVTINHKQEVIFGLSNSGNSDDLERSSRSLTY